MTRLHIVLLIFLAFLCLDNNKYFQTVNDPVVSYVDRTFEPYIRSFEYEGSLLVPKDLSIIFQDFEEGAVIGFCQKTTDGYRRITILPAWWDMVDETRREMLIFHELAHCVLAAEHTEETDSNGVPSSLMYPEISDSLVKAYGKDRKKYLDRLFGR